MPLQGLPLLFPPRQASAPCSAQTLPSVSCYHPFPFPDDSSSLDAVVAEHRRTSERTNRCNSPLVLVSACSAATAAAAARGTRAAAPLALSAALNLGIIVSAQGCWCLGSVWAGADRGCIKPGHLMDRAPLPKALNHVHPARFPTLQAFTFGVVAPLQRTIYESSNKDKGATRAALRRWAGEHGCWVLAPVL